MSPPSTSYLRDGSSPMHLPVGTYTQCFISLRKHSRLPPACKTLLPVSAGESMLWVRLSSTHQGTACCYLSSFKRYAKVWVLKPERLLRNEAYANPSGDRDG